ncbi:MAG: hypothetical protein RSA87_03705 [Malacoplasma sp.]
MDLNSIINIALSGIAGAVLALIGNNFLVNKRSKNYDLKLEKELAIYKYKTEAILEAIDFLENYIASSQVEKSPFKKMTVSELTISARACMDKLVVYCDNAELVETFDSIILKGETVKSNEFIERFKNFRNLCRKELGLKNVKFQKDEFYWLISTSNIKK